MARFEHRDEDYPIVKPGPLVDKLDGRTPMDFWGLCRITCRDDCKFSVEEREDLIVKPNGFSIVNWGAPGGTGSSRIVGPVPWPPDWWPARCHEGGHEHGNGEGLGEGNGEEISAPLSAPAATPKPRPAPAPRGHR